MFYIDCLKEAALFRQNHNLTSDRRNDAREWTVISRQANLHANTTTHAYPQHWECFYNILL